VKSAAQAGQSGVFSGPGLVLLAEPGKDIGDDSAFSRSVWARYGGARDRAALIEDMRQFGLECGTEASDPAAIADCQKVEQANSVCFDVWALTIAPASDRASDAVVKQPRYARRCLGALAP
jgi:hypothetical protein